MFFFDLKRIPKPQKLKEWKWEWTWLRTQENQRCWKSAQKATIWFCLAFLATLFHFQTKSMTHFIVQRLFSQMHYCNRQIKREKSFKMSQGTFHNQGGTTRMSSHFCDTLHLGLGKPAICGWQRWEGVQKYKFLSFINLP